jgi:hypothetical protein
MRHLRGTGHSSAQEAAAMNYRLVTLMESGHVGPFNLGDPGEFTMLDRDCTGPASLFELLDVFQDPDFPIR